jgi:hypothetical protein
MMSRVSRLLLKTITAAAPVFMAACYGPPIGFYKAGTVVDSVSGAGIPGVQVECLEGGQVMDTRATGTDGSFVMSTDASCDQLRFTDIDGAANGSYTAQTVAAVDDGTELTVQLAPTT